MSRQRLPPEEKGEGGENPNQQKWETCFGEGSAQLSLEERFCIFNGILRNLAWDMQHQIDEAIEFIDHATDDLDQTLMEADRVLNDVQHAKRTIAHATDRLQSVSVTRARLNTLTALCDHVIVNERQILQSFGYYSSVATEESKSVDQEENSSIEDVSGNKNASEESETSKNLAKKQKPNDQGCHAPCFESIEVLNNSHGGTVARVWKTEVSFDNKDTKLEITESVNDQPIDDNRKIVAVKSNKKKIPNQEDCEEDKK